MRLQSNAVQWKVKSMGHLVCLEDVSIIIMHATLVLIAKQKFILLLISFPVYGELGPTAETKPPKYFWSVRLGKLVLKIDKLHFLALSISHLSIWIDSPKSN